MACKRYLLKTTDVHVGGDVHPIVTGGFGRMPGGALLEQRDYLRDKAETLRRFLLEEPRGGHRNEVVLFLKASAVVGAITIFDVLAVARQAVDRYDDPFAPLVMAGVFYWVIVQGVQHAFDRLDERLSLAKRH
jgi:ABC-type arginine/histidine transport system permease subunit